MLKKRISMITTSGTLLKPRFPRLQECAHFHYEVSTVDIPKNFKVVMCADSSPTPSYSSSNESPNGQSTTATASMITSMTAESKPSSALTASTMSSTTGDGSFVFQIQVTANDKRWIICRTYENFRYLDKHLHDCIFDRKFSCLEEPLPLALLCAGNGSSGDPMTSSISSVISTCSSIAGGKKMNSHNGTSNSNSALHKQLTSSLAQYLARFCEIAFINPINCGPILNWFEVRIHSSILTTR